MTLNDLELRNSPYFAFFIEFDSFAGRLCQWLKIDRPMMSVKYVLPVSVWHN